MATYGTVEYPLSIREGTVRQRVSIFDYLREQCATVWVAYFFALYSINVSPKAVPLGVIAGFVACCFLYHRELYYFVTNKPIVVLYVVIVLLSATWSIVPSQSIWYGLQLAITIASAILMGVAASSRQIVRGVFIAMAIVIVASIISGRHGASAAGPVLVGVTGSKTAIGMDAVVLVGSGLALLLDRQQPFAYRLSAILLIPLGAYIATHVEATTAKLAVVAFPLAFLGFLALRFVGPAGRWGLIGLLLAFAVACSIIFALSGASKDADQKILRALNKDSTLTGRTLIWAKADDWSEKSPIVGFGFRAFWASGSSDSVGILHNFGLIDPRAFQIHNTIKEIRVDTGLFGLAIFVSTVACFLYYILAFALLRPTASSAFLATIFLMTISMAPIDTIIGVFFSATTFFYLCGTAAMVHFMNGALQTDYNDRPARRAPTFGGRHIRRVRKPAPPVLGDSPTVP